MIDLLAPGGGLDRAILERAASGIPVLGICLGFQLLTEGSDEAPGDIDEALIRPGRFFAVVRTRGLSRDEAIRFLAALSIDSSSNALAVIERAFSGGSKSVTLAELYRAISRG